MEPAAQLESILFEGIILVQAEKGFQSQILRLSRVANEPMQDAIDVRPILPEQGFELLRV
jgi:hypothetical protein